MGIGGKILTKVLDATVKSVLVLTPEIGHEKGFPMEAVETPT